MRQSSFTLGDGTETRIWPFRHLDRAIFPANIEAQPTASIVPGNDKKLNSVVRDSVASAARGLSPEPIPAISLSGTPPHNGEVDFLSFQKLYDNAPVALLTLDQFGVVTNLNNAASILLGVTKASAVGKSLNKYLTKNSQSVFAQHLRKSRFSVSAPARCDLEFRANNDRIRSAQLVTNCIVSAGEARIFQAALIDITAQRIAVDAAAHAREYAESIVSAIPYPLVVLDPRARVVSANSSFYYLFQTNEAQVIGWPVTQLPDLTWQHSNLDSVLMNAFADRAAVENVAVYADVRGTVLTLIVTARLIPGLADPRGPFLLVSFNDITRSRRAEEQRELLLTELQESKARMEVRVQDRTQELTRSYARLRSMGEQLVLAHESEQRRIARELHDQIGQDLTALKMILSRAKAFTPAVALTTVREAEALTNEILQTVRNICGTLRPQVLDDLGLVAGLQWHIKTFSARTGLSITFDVQHFDEKLLTPILKSTIFRVIQEALTNVSRHARTDTASVLLANRKGAVEFSIRDGGRGFDPDDPSVKNSIGISGMRERLSLVQGRFEISSSPGQGTVIRACIPLQQERATEATTISQSPTSEPNRNHHGKRTKNQSRHSRRSSSRPQGPQIPPHR